MLYRTVRFAVLYTTALAACGLAQAQEKMDGSDYHPLMMNSPASAQVQAGAMAAARPAGTELVGQTTAPAPGVSTTSADEAQRGAWAASHAGGSELSGQSTAAPLPRPAGGAE